MKKRGFKRFYTLIEIMTVIVIAAILFGIGIPAFSTMIRGSNMTIAIRQLSSKIAAARAYAVTNATNDTRIAVLLVETGVKEEYRYSAYRVCVVNSSNVFQEWIEDENWKTLPKGVLRILLSSDGSIETVSIDATDIGGTDSTTVKALIFKKNGQLTQNSSPTIRLCQGRYAGGNLVFTERADGGNIINQPITVNRYSGKVKVEETDDTKTESQMKGS